MRDIDGFAALRRWERQYRRTLRQIRRSWEESYRQIAAIQAQVEIIRRAAARVPSGGEEGR